MNLSLLLALNSGFNQTENKMQVPITPMEPLVKRNNLYI